MLFCSKWTCIGRVADSRYPLNMGRILRIWAISVRLNIRLDKSPKSCVCLLWQPHSAPPYGLCIEIPAQVTNDPLTHTLPLLVAMAPYRHQQCSQALHLPSTTNQPTDWIDLVCFSQTKRIRWLQTLISVGHTTLAPERWIYPFSITRHSSCH